MIGRRRRSRAAVVWLAVLAVLLQATSAHAYLKFGVPVNGRTVTLKWGSGAVHYRVYELGVPGVSASDFRDAVARAFTTWEEVPTAGIRYAFDGFTVSSRPGDEDSVNTLGFDERPELENVLASTSLLIDEETGALVESDIFFNSAFAWSVAPGGEAGKFDLQSIAVHEIGHFSGLGHSALGETELTAGGRRVLAAEAVMFPIAFGPGNIAERQLHADDIAGISDLYPDGSFNQSTGSLSGSVTHNGVPVYGAHVVAFNPRTGDLVGNFTLNSAGQFSIGGLSPGAYIVRVEPIDDAEVTSFLEEADRVDVEFRSTIHSRLVVVPRRGDSGQITIPVAAR